MHQQQIQIHIHTLRIQELSLLLPCQYNNFLFYLVIYAPFNNVMHMMARIHSLILRSQLQEVEILPQFNSALIQSLLLPYKYICDALSEQHLHNIL